MIKGYIQSVPGLPIIKGAGRDLYVEHFLQTHSLGAELDLIAILGFGLAALILNRKRLPGPAFGSVKFNHIGLADQSQLEGSKR
jgi:hypothetical protein